MIHIEAKRVESSRSIRVDNFGRAYNVSHRTSVKQIDTLRVARWNPQNKTKKGKVAALRLQYWRIPLFGELRPWWNTAEQFHSHDYSTHRRSWRPLKKTKFEKP